MAVTAFLQALNFAVVQCDVSVVFKVAQVRALEAVYLGRDVIGVLPTGSVNIPVDSQPHQF